MGEDNNLMASIASIAAEMKTIEVKIVAGVQLEQHEIDRFDVIRRELAKLRDQWVVEECGRGTPQCRVAQMIGITPSRVTQIMALYKGA
jgi:hypothetical protein